MQMKVKALRCKNSMLRRHRLRSQSAMEYLMTYGWTILIIAVVLGAIYQLGIFNSSTFSPKAVPGSCKVYRPNGPGTTTFINLEGACSGQQPQFVAVLTGSGNIRVNNLIWGVSTIPSGATFSVWIKYVGATGCPSLAFMENSLSTNQRIGLDAGCNNFNPYFLTEHPVWPSEWSVTYSSASVGKWYNIVGVYNSVADAIYVNGVFITSTTTPNAIPGFGSSAYMRIADGFNGYISNIQVYNTSFDASQVQTLYARGIGGVPISLPYLVGWWPLNKNATDYSGNNQNGVPTSVVFTNSWTA